MWKIHDKSPFFNLALNCGEKKYFNNCKLHNAYKLHSDRCRSQEDQDHEDNLFIKILTIKNQQISRCLHVGNAIYYNIWVFEINQIHFLLNNLTTYRQSLPHSIPPPPTPGSWFEQTCTTLPRDASTPVTVCLANWCFKREY